MIGAPVYYGRIPQVRGGLFGKLHGENTPALFVVSYGNRAFEDALLELSDYCARQGFFGVGAGAFIAPHTFSARIGEGRPDEKDRKAVACLAEKTKECLESGKTAALGLPGNRPYREFQTVPFAPKGDVYKRQALRHLSRKAEEHHIRIDLADDMLMADVDVQLIVQVMINLVDNAVKYTQPGSDILISAARRGKEAVVCVADNGKGISDADKKNIFDMFYTAGGKQTDSRRGLGLGLALCRTIVEAHGGRIRVKDNEPCGTVFELSLIHI